MLNWNERIGTLYVPIGKREFRKIEQNGCISLFYGYTDEKIAAKEARKREVSLLLAVGIPYHLPVEISEVRYSGTSEFVEIAQEFETLGQQIRRWRDEHQYSLLEASKRLRVFYTSIAQYEAEIVTPRKDRAKKIRALIGCKQKRNITE